MISETLKRTPDPMDNEHTTVIIIASPALLMISKHKIYIIFMTIEQANDISVLTSKVLNIKSILATMDIGKTPVSTLEINKLVAEVMIAQPDHKSPKMNPSHQFQEEGHEDCNLGKDSFSSFWFGSATEFILGSIW